MVTINPYNDGSFLLSWWFLTLEESLKRTSFEFLKECEDGVSGDVSLHFVFLHVATSGVNDSDLKNKVWLMESTVGSSSSVTPM